MNTTAPVSIVFGASGGIGSALARLLAQAGHQLVVVARQAERLQALTTELNATALTADATVSAEVDVVVTQVQERFGRLDGVASCIGSLMLKPAHLTTDEEWRQTIDINLTSSFYILRAAARVMRPNGGSIVFCSSVAAQRGLANHEAIAGAKAGIVGLILAAAATYASNRVRVNCVAPGLTRTPLTASLTANEMAQKASVAMHPLGRLGEPEDVASAVAWLLDSKQSWITGQVISVDGGMSTVQARPRV